MTLIDDFNSMMKRAILRKDLRKLETLSQTILSFMNRPQKYTSVQKKYENIQLKEVFGQISIYIVYLTNRGVSHN